MTTAMTTRNLAVKVALCVTIALAFLSSAWAEDREESLQRVQASADVLNDIMAAPDKGIPLDIMNSALCVGVVPALKKGGFVFGAEYGKGMATCRTSTGWSAPAPFKVTGGSWGLQIGGQEVDLVMLVMNKKGMERLLSSKFKLGADASAAAGPVGRHVEGETDWKMRAEVLTYSRARGLFAGVTVNGAVIDQDGDSTRALYGSDPSFKTILEGEAKAPAGTEPFLAAVKKFSVKATTAQNNNNGNNDKPSVAQK
ncbi:MAG TPA: lipid-binding SYLF domain-containing protein [Candidatus Angelobacter sp.]|jgi:lipid-binding SYLF domain-containing protein|nr:lipid-binding SYLF domain-containing protein [Candidatus Angelobacter sp.]